MLQLDNQACFALYALSREIINHYRPLLDGIDLTYPQYLALMVLWECQPQTVNQLGERLRLDSGTLTPLLKRLEQKKLIVRTRRSSDERVVEITLTPSGKELKNKALEIPTKVMQSMANEYDFMNAKKLSDWDYYIEQFAKRDTFHHLIGIHNGTRFYDHTNPYITHASIQSEDTYRAKEYRMKYRKPVVFDECRYEGNIPWSWGNLTAQTMVEKFWRGVTNGGYVGHGETYVTENPVKLPNESSDILWWSKGGVLRGESPDRIKFLRSIIESAPAHLTPIPLFTCIFSQAQVPLDEQSER